MAQYLADTNALVWWFTNRKRLSSDQLRVLRALEGQQQSLHVSAITLLELAIVFGVGNRKNPEIGARLIQNLEDNPGVLILPLSLEVATEIATMGDALRDPMDRAIVATARVHRMTLITADERIITSNLARVIH